MKGDSVPRSAVQGRKELSLVVVVVVAVNGCSTGCVEELLW